MKRVSFWWIFYLVLPVSVMARPVSNEVILDQMNRQFEQVNLRFEQMQKQIDERFEQMQKQMDIRFEEMGKRMDERFEQIDKRFEQVDKRFEFIQYLLIALLASVVGMPLLARKWEKAREKEIDEVRRFLIAMKELAITDERLAKAFKAAGLV
ncbi:MAG: hypothetical protein AB1797_03270 [bacterium]